MSLRKKPICALKDAVLQVTGALQADLDSKPSVDDVEQRFVDQVAQRKIHITRRSDTLLTFNGQPVEKVLAGVLLENRLMVEFRRLPRLTSVDLYRFAAFLRNSCVPEGLLVNISSSGSLDWCYMNVEGN